jgi:hypothetical protein
MQHPTPDPLSSLPSTSTRPSRSLPWRIARRTVISLAFLVTLMALFYTEEYWRGRHAWEAYQAANQLPRFSDFVPAQVPDDENFTMTPFLAPLFDLNPEPLQAGQSRWRDTNGLVRAQSFGHDMFKANRSPLTGQWMLGHPLDLPALAKLLSGGSNNTANFKNDQTRAEAASLVLGALEHDRAILDELLAASRRPHARFNIHYRLDSPWAILLPHLSVLKYTSEVLCLRASAELAAGQTEAAFNDADLLLYLSDSIREEPFIISSLVRVADLKNYAIQVIWEGLASRQWSEAQLRTLEARLAEPDLPRELRRNVQAERAMHNAGLDALRDDPARGRLFADLVAGGELWQGAAFRWLFPRGWMYQEQINCSRLYEDNLPAEAEPGARVIHPGLIAAKQNELVGDLAGGGKSPILHHLLFARMLVPALSGAYQKAALSQAFLDEAGIACALERYRLANGSLPETLDALSPRFIETIPHDVIDGGALHYKKTQDDQFVLYSIGWNEKDDSATVVLNKNGDVVEVAQGDWVWPAYPPR